MYSLSQQVTVLSTGTTATSGNLTGPTIDLASAAAGGGYFAEGVLFVAHLSASNASMLLKTQTGTASDAMSDTTGDVGGTLRTLYLDHHRPSKRFIRGVVKGATTTGAYNVLDTIVYGMREKPPTYDASTTGLRVYSPGSGTATG